MELTGIGLHPFHSRGCQQSSTRTPELRERRCTPATPKRPYKANWTTSSKMMKGRSAYVQLHSLGRNCRPPALHRSDVYGNESMSGPHWQSFVWQVERQRDLYVRRPSDLYGRTHPPYRAHRSHSMHSAPSSIASVICMGGTPRCMRGWQCFVWEAGGGWSHLQRLQRTVTAVLLLRPDAPAQQGQPHPPHFHAAGSDLYRRVGSNLFRVASHSGRHNGCAR